MGSPALAGPPAGDPGGGDQVHDGDLGGGLLDPIPGSGGDATSERGFPFVMDPLAGGGFFDPPPDYNPGDGSILIPPGGRSAGGFGSGGFGSGGSAAPSPFQCQDFGGTAQAFSDLCERLEVGFNASRQIIYIIGGFGAIGLGVGAFFGRFKWPWFFSLGSGIFIVSAIEQIVLFLESTAGP